VFALSAALSAVAQAPRPGVGVVVGRFSEKLPTRCSASGTTVLKLHRIDLTQPPVAAKEKRLILDDRTAESRAEIIDVQRRSCSLARAKLRRSWFSRWNSNTEPCTWFVPDFVKTVTMPAPVRP